MMFSVLSVAIMGNRFVHCSATFTTLVLPVFGKFVAVFLIAHLIKPFKAIYISPLFLLKEAMYFSIDFHNN